MKVIVEPAVVPVPSTDVPIQIEGVTVASGSRSLVASYLIKSVFSISRGADLVLLMPMPLEMIGVETEIAVIAKPSPVFFALDNGLARAKRVHKLDCVELDVQRRGRQLLVVGVNGVTRPQKS